MRLTRLGNTDMMVSELALGTVNYGSALKSVQVDEQMDCYVAMGGNFLDTARVYGDWVPGTSGLSEKSVGQWLRNRKNRSKIILSTKGGHPRLATMEIPRMDKVELRADLEESLRHLQTDYIDLYFLHRDDTNIPIPELLDCLEQWKMEGVIRYYGCSNWSLQRLQEARNYADQKGYSGFVSNQILASLADVNGKWCKKNQFVAMTEEFQEFHQKTGDNLMAYMSGSNGYFVKRFLEKEMSADMQEKYGCMENDAIYSHLLQACSNEKEILAYCYRFITNRGYSTVPIASFTTLEQLKMSMESFDEPIDESMLREMGLLKRQV